MKGALYCLSLLFVKLRSLILKLGFSRLLLSKSDSNKIVHGDKAQLPPISHQGLAYLSLLSDAAVTCTKQRFSSRIDEN